ncbi:MAG: MFS transporter [Chloroflexi bacterium]|nr:MFS transporter [Chloroflexota bacterium]
MPFRTPFFYGWVIILVGALTGFSSGPGQSYIFSVFIDSIIEDTSLTRTGISTLYAVGTGLSAAMVMIVSRLADRYGARSTLMGAAFGLGLACLAMSQVREAFLVFLAFSALRALGQGSMSINGTLLAAQWFVRRRGRAIAIMGLGFPASMAILPPFARFLVDTIGWREAYAVLGIMVWVLVLPAAFFLVRERPEAVGLYPDGADQPPPGEEVSPGLDTGGPDRRRVLTSLRFWTFALPFATPGLVVTALVFHQVAIFEEQGLTAQLAAGVFVPYAIATASISVFAGIAVDRFGPKGVFIGSMLTLLAAMGVALVMDSIAGATVYGLLIGVSSGMSMIVGQVAWAHYYGRNGLGRVQGSAMMVGVTGSALGPLPLAWLESIFGGFGPGIVVLGVLPILSIITIAFARPPNSTAAITGV